MWTQDLLLFSDVFMPSRLTFDCGWNDFSLQIKFWVNGEEAEDERLEKTYGSFYIKTAEHTELD